MRLAPDPTPFAALRRSADLVGNRGCRLLLPEGDDARVRAAAASVAQRQWASVTLVTENPVAGVDQVTEAWLRRQVVGTAHLNLSELSAAAVADGVFDGVVMGATTHSKEVLAAGLAHLTSPGVRVSGAAWVDAVDIRGREVIFVDPSVNVKLDPSTLAAGLCDAADLLERVLETDAVIGLMSWSGLGSGAVDRTYAAVVEQVRLRGREVSGGRPLQADALIDATVALAKGVAGHNFRPANVLGFPSLDAANIGVKLVEVLGGAATCSFNTGFTRPFNDVSRSASVEALLAAAALTVVQWSATTTC